MITRKSSGPETNCSPPKEDPTAARKLVRALPAILRVIPCSRKRSFLEVNEKMITIDANPSPRRGLPTEVSRMVRHCDQDEREQDGWPGGGVLKAVP